MNNIMRALKLNYLYHNVIHLYSFPLLVPNVKDDTSYLYVISTVLYIVTVLGPLVNITVLMLIS